MIMDDTSVIQDTQSVQKASVAKSEPLLPAPAVKLESTPNPDQRVTRSRVR